MTQTTDLLWIEPALHAKSLGLVKKTEAVG
jgi:hypothetical protein